MTRYLSAMLIAVAGSLAWPALGSTADSPSGARPIVQDPLVMRLSKDEFTALRSVSSAGIALERLQRRDPLQGQVED